MKNKAEYLILGGGIAGVSASYHLGHEKCLVLEKSSHLFGVLKSREQNGYTWDRGPHVSFTKSEYVADLFASNVGNMYHEVQVNPLNFFEGSWINHPVQTNLFQVPEPLRDRCLSSFMDRGAASNDGVDQLTTYDQWLRYSLGDEITETFVARYTRKYWTTEPENLGVDWIGPRMHAPAAEAVINGALEAPKESSHYITKIRYPARGGYESFVRPLADGINAKLAHEITSICLESKVVTVASGEVFHFDKLVTTLPLPIFVRLVEQSDEDVIHESTKLSCSSLYLVNLEIPHNVDLATQWFYVYDDDLISCRVTIMSHLSNQNGPLQSTGVQVEVYESKFRQMSISLAQLPSRIVDELIVLGITTEKYANEINVTVDYLSDANIICDHARKKALSRIFDFYTTYGYVRRRDELHPLTDWSAPLYKESGYLYFVGRYAEWKYYWSDDCILSARSVATAELGSHFNEKAAL